MVIYFINRGSGKPLNLHKDIQMKIKQNVNSVVVVAVVYLSKALDIANCL